MKKTLYAALALLLFASCNKSNTVNNTEDVDHPQQGQQTASIVGNWSCNKAVEYEPGEEPEEDYGVSIYVSCKSDNTFTMTYNGAPNSGTWTLKSNVLTLYNEGTSVISVFTVIKLTAQELVLRQYADEEEGEYEEFYFKRVSTPEPSTNTNDLDGTKWAGVALQTNVEFSFIDDECYLVLSGYANCTAVGTYKTSSPDVYVTLTKITGDSDGQLKVGDVISGKYDLSAKQMTVKIVLYGELREIQLYQTK